MKWAIDVSSYDAVLEHGAIQAVDWKRARDEGEISLAIIKCSEGLRQDPAFNIQWKAASGILPRAAYHFFRSNVNSITQAQSCWSYLSAAGFTKGDYLILDYETLDGTNPSKSLLSAASWLYEMEKYGVTPMIYTYPGFWQSFVGVQVGWAAKYPLVLAQWPRDTWILNYSPTIFNAAKFTTLKKDIESGILKPVALKPWSSPAIWQFSARVDSKAIPGHPSVKKVVDYNAVLMPLTQAAVENPGTGGEIGGNAPADPSAQKRCPCCGQVIKDG